MTKITVDRALIDLAIAGGLLLVCVWGAAFIAGFVWEWVKP